MDSGNCICVGTAGGLLNAPGDHSFWNVAGLPICKILPVVLADQCLLLVIPLRCAGAGPVRDFKGMHLKSRHGNAQVLFCNAADVITVPLVLQHLVVNGVCGIVQFGCFTGEPTAIFHQRPDIHFSQLTVMLDGEDGKNLQCLQIRQRKCG